MSLPGQILLQHLLEPFVRAFQIDVQDILQALFRVCTLLRLQIAPGTALLNGEVDYRIHKNRRTFAEFLNLLNGRDHDIAYVFEVSFSPPSSLVDVQWLYV
jgi:hypothetical protein